MGCVRLCGDVLRNSPPSLFPLCAPQRRYPRRGLQPARCLTSRGSSERLQECGPRNLVQAAGRVARPSKPGQISATCLPAAGRSPGGARSPSPRRWALPRLMQDSRPQGEKHLPPTQPSALLTRAAGASEARGPRGSGGSAGSAGFWPGVFRRRSGGSTGGKRRRVLSYRFRPRETGPESPGAPPGLGGGHRPRSLSWGPASPQCRTPHKPRHSLPCRTVSRQRQETGSSPAYPRK